MTFEEFWNQNAGRYFKIAQRESDAIDYVKMAIQRAAAEAWEIGQSNTVSEPANTAECQREANYNKMKKQMSTKTYKIFSYLIFIAVTIFVLWMSYNDMLPKGYAFS